MIYNGQLDIIIAVPLTEAWILTVPWSGQDDYMKAKRFVWKVDPKDLEVAGWVRQVKNFYQVNILLACGVMIVSVCGSTAVTSNRNICWYIKARFVLVSLFFDTKVKRIHL
jgi:hypothetical protein